MINKIKSLFGGNTSEVKRMQGEINRLRKVLHGIADTRPDEYMDIAETPELTLWICEACTTARYEAYPHNYTNKQGDK